jgi:hypothetical protein
MLEGKEEAFPDQGQGSHISSREEGIPQAEIAISWGDCVGHRPGHSRFPIQNEVFLCQISPSPRRHPSCFRIYAWHDADFALFFASF